MNDKKINALEIDRQVQEAIDLLAQLEPGDARQHYLAGVAAGMRYAGTAATAAAPVKAEAKGEGRTA